MAICRAELRTTRGDFQYSTDASLANGCQASTKFSHVQSKVVNRSKVMASSENMVEAMMASHCLWAGARSY